MRLARRQLLTLTLVAAAAPAVFRTGLVRPARGDAPITLKLHHPLSSVSSGHNKFLAPWARKVEAESGGRVRIDIFPSMELGGAPAHLYDQARDGVADIVWAQPSNTPGRFPKIEAFELPFVASRRAVVNSKALADYGTANLGDEFRDVHPLCFGCQDQSLIHANRQVASLEDLKGLKLHSPTRIAAQALRALGATGVGVPLLQLPLAISQHIVDGCVVPWEATPALKLQDVLKFHTEAANSPALTTTTFVLAMNKRAYDRLPADLKKVFDDNSGEAAAAIAGAMWDAEAAAVSDAVRQRGDTITALPAEEAARWHKATEPVIAGWLKQMKEHRVDGTKLLANARMLLAKHEPDPDETAPRQQAPQPEPPGKPAEPPAAQAAPPKAAEAAPSAPPAAPAAVANPAPVKPPTVVKPPPKPAVLDIPM